MSSIMIEQDEKLKREKRGGGEKRKYAYNEND